VAAALRPPPARRASAASGAAQFGQVGEGEQGAGDRVGDRGAGPVGQPTAGGGRQQRGEVLAPAVGSGGERGQRAARGADPTGRTGLPGGLVAGVGSLRGAHRLLRGAQRQAGGVHRRAGLVDRPVGGGPPNGPAAHPTEGASAPRVLVCASPPMRSIICSNTRPTQEEAAGQGSAESHAIGPGEDEDRESVA
jgi:hypothetical protein